jgi:hypothetical protein
MWQLLVDFLREFTAEAIRGTKKHWKGIAIFTTLAFVSLILLVVLALKATANYQFCGLCHNMSTYIESWKNSTHAEASCLECHFEPGLWGELKGKWKAQLHVVMMITGTSHGKPHTEIADASCLRAGCHSTTDLRQEEVNFKGVSFSHDTHLSELRRGKKLKCVSCHSQIVQGKHMTVTESTCFTCHFYRQGEHPELGDCALCHPQTRAKIFIDASENLPFIHQDYLDRGVLCEQCHYNVVHGDGGLVANTCVQCHDEPELLRSKHTSEQIHQNHVTTHKVECYRCHEAIEHYIIRGPESRVPGKKGLGGLPKTAHTKAANTGYNYDANCVKCHQFDQHGAMRRMYMGQGAAGLSDMPSAMFLSHLDCAACHVKLTERDGIVRGITRAGFDEIIASCTDCHGPGYDDMARHWKKVLNDELRKTEKLLLEARNKTAGTTGATAKDAEALLETAGRNLQFAKLGHGLHNIDYALKILADSREKVEKAKELVIPGYAARAVTSPSGCTDLCHNCVECIETKPVPFGEVQFPHDIHVQDEGIGCEECHSPREQHGRTYLRHCSECHHGSGMGMVTCADCHVAAYNLYHGQNACDEISCDVRGEKNVMAAAGITCQECHTAIVADKDSSLDSIKTSCTDCHDTDYAAMVDDWKTEAEALGIEQMQAEIQAVQRQILAAIRNGQYTYDAQDLINNADKNLTQLIEGNPIHNLAFSRDLAAKVRMLLDKTKEKLQHHSTIRTLAEEEYK